MYDTQKNEGLNSAVARVAPKCRTYCQSASLWARISLVIGEQNCGIKKFWQHLLENVFGINIPSSIIHFFINRDQDLQSHREYKTRTDVKRSRINNYIERLKVEIKKQI